MKVSPKNQFGKLNVVKYYIETVQTNLGTAKSYLDIVPERIYNSHYGNGVPAMFTS